MSGTAMAETRRVAKPALNRVTGSVLQRQCACGAHTIAGASCAQCSGKQQLQRHSMDNRLLSVDDASTVRNIEQRIDQPSPRSTAPFTALRFRGNLNGLPLHVKSSGRVQPKIAVKNPDDIYEREADRLSDEVMRMSAPGADKTREKGSGERVALRRAEGDAIGPIEAPQIVQDVLTSPGQPLDPATRAFFEPRFGHDFSQVRVHADGKAAESARTINASAYTVGRNVVFRDGYYKMASVGGRQLLAHELAHVVQQTMSGGFSNRVMRKGFESTIQVCHRQLETRKFDVTNGGVRVALLLKDLDRSIPNCQDFDFGVTLNRSIKWWPDKEIGACESSTGGTRSFLFGNLPSGTYYLTIWRTFDHPYCCLDGDILVFDEMVSNDSAGCKRAKELSTMDIVHGALDIAGFIPVLGAIPDGINASIYVVEGDWANAGLSAIAAIPAWGDGVKLASIGGKSLLKVSEKAALRLGEEGIAKGFKEVKAASGAAHAVEEGASRVGKEAVQVEKEAATIEKGAGKIEKEAATVEKDAGKIEKEAAEKAAAKELRDKIAECEAIYLAYDALKSTCRSCKSTDTAAERATKIACLTALLAGRKKYLEKKCDYVLAGSIARGSAIAERGHQTAAYQVGQQLLKCSSLPTAKT
jgi:hypothetical protein